MLRDVQVDSRVVSEEVMRDAREWRVVKEVETGVDITARLWCMDKWGCMCSTLNETLTLH
jgi:hypothetical protein